MDKVTSSDEDSSSEETQAQIETSNSVMNMMNSLYSQPPRNPLLDKPISEPIDISSGDENDDDSNGKSTNGKSPISAPAPAPVSVSTHSSALKRLMTDSLEPTSAPKKRKLDRFDGKLLILTFSSEI